MADQASSEGAELSGSAAPEVLEVTHAPAAGTEALITQQTALMQELAQQVKELSTCVQVAEEVAAKAAAQGSETAQKRDAELEA